MRGFLNRLREWREARRLRTERARYSKAMFVALDRIRVCSISGHEVSRLWATRVIRDFQRINGVKFDPFNEYHCNIVGSWGPHRKFMSRVSANTHIKGDR